MSLDLTQYANTESLGLADMVRLMAAERLHVRRYGAKADLVFGTDGAITGGDGTFVSAATTFTTDDIGKSIWIEGAGPSGAADHLTTIDGVNSAHSIELTVDADFTVTGARFRYFTDNTTALTNGHNEAASKGLHLRYGRGAYGWVDSLPVFDNLFISGDGFTNDASSNGGQGTILCCCAPVPAIYSATQINNFSAEKMTFIGTSRSGSMGLSIGPIYGLFLRDLAFSYFGDQGVYVHSPGQGDGRVSNVFATDVLKVRSRADFAGGLHFDLSDLRIESCQSTTSVSFPAGTIIGGLYGDGHGAGILISSNQCFASKCVAHGSQIGFYIAAPTMSSFGANNSTFVNCRADLNQGPGWVIEASGCQLIGPRSHTNSLHANHTYPAYLVGGGSNQLIGAQSTDNLSVGDGSPVWNYHSAHIETTSPNTEQGHRFIDSHPNGRYSAGEFVFSGTQQDHVVVDGTLTDPVGIPSYRFQTNISIRDKVIFHVKPDGPTDEKVWKTRMNYGSGFSQRIHTACADDYATETPYMVESRSTGIGMDFVEVLNALFKASAGIALTGTLAVPVGSKFLFSGVSSVIYSAGDPNGVYTAEPSSLAFDGNNSTIWMKKTGVGTNTGWVKILAFDTSSLTANQPTYWTGSAFATDKIALDDPTNKVTGILGVANGGTGSSTVPYYTKSEIDTMLAVFTAAISALDLAKANRGDATSTNSGHSHNQQ